MFTPHDPAENSGPVPAWPAPSNLDPPDEDPPSAPPPTGPRTSGRRRLALGALVIATVAGGTAGGAIAGRSTDRTASHAATTPTGFRATSASTAGSNSAKSDVSALIQGALPSVVSISVELNGNAAAGTGFIISSDGQIVTNAHVVADASSIKVEFSDRTSAPAKVLGVDRTDDLAVVKVDKVGLTALPLGSSADLQMGQPVVAIGNALDLTGGPTATEGIVSALDRSIDTSDGEHLSHLVQTDAAINPGNSGGPLLTLDGKVVGIDSAGSTDAQNIGFAIAIDTAKPIVAQLQQGKTVTKAFLGVSTTPIDATAARQNGLKVDHGLLVVDVTGKSAAEKAGVRPGDVIVAVDGTTTNDLDGLGQAIAAAGAGHVVHLTIDRNGATVDITATLSSSAA